MDAGASTDATVALDRFPSPACSYRFAQGVAVVTDTNDQLAARCGLAPGDRLEHCFETTFAVDGELPSFDREERCRLSHPTALASRQFVVQILPPSADEPGHLLFTPIESSRQSDDIDVDHMASVLSHDLRNPLDVACARLRAGRELDEDVHFDHVERAHDRMEQIIQDVLTLTRGEDVVSPDERVDLSQLVRDAWRTVETQQATIQVSDSLPTVEVDADRVRRLFENLFRNSIDHSTGDDLRVTVASTADGIYVADDGPGIDEEEQEQIFEPGYSTDQHGMGLGLAIVEQIATLHGWSVAVETAASGGARFELTDLASD